MSSTLMLIACLGLVQALEASQPFSALQRDLLQYGVGTSCSVGDEKGACLNVAKSDCQGGRWEPDLCPGNSNVRCCIQPCHDPSSDRTGQCVPTRHCLGDAVGGLCGGPWTVKCCLGPSTIGGDSGAPGSCDPIKRLRKTAFDAYQRGNRIGTVETIMYPGTEKRVEVNTACAFYKMSAVAKAAGTRLTLNSGFRTMAEQEYFYNCYIHQNCNSGNLAAKPGYSNHQNGKALDISTTGNAYTWLAANAQSFGFVRTVCSERWHWEYRPGTGKNAFCKNV